MARLSTLILLSAFLLAGCAAARAQEDAPPALLFVVTGQSNAGQLGRAGAAVPGAWYYAPQLGARVLPLGPVDGTFGAELGFARAVREACPGREVLIVKRWRNATGIEAWQPASGRMWRLTAAAVERGRALFGRPVEAAGVLWIQNEYDTRTAARGLAYEGRLRALVGAWRAAWGPVPVMLMGVHTDGGGAGSVAAALEAVAADGGAAVVRADDLPVKDDGVHFDNAGMDELGQRMAAAWLALRGGCE